MLGGGESPVTSRCQTFSKWCPLTLSSAWDKSPAALTPSSTLDIDQISTFFSFDGCEMVSRCGLICISLITNEAFGENDETD